MQINIVDARNQLSELVQAALAGEDVVIANNGVPVVRLVKIGARDVVRKPGAWAALPRARRDWDLKKTNAEIAETLTSEAARSKRK